MAAADPADQAAGESLVAEAGEIDPLTGFAIGEQRGGAVRVAMSLETDAQARDNADRVAPHSPRDRRPGRAVTSGSGSRSATWWPTGAW